MPPRALPYPDDIRAAPELSAVAVLDTALAVARTALLVHNPEIADLGENFQARAPPLCSALAALLVARADELSELIGWYVLVVDDLRRGGHHDDMPF